MRRSSRGVSLPEASGERGGVEVEDRLGYGRLAFGLDDVDLDVGMDPGTGVGLGWLWPCGDRGMGVDVGTGMGMDMGMDWAWAWGWAMGLAGGTRLGKMRRSGSSIPVHAAGLVGSRRLVVSTSHIFAVTPVARSNAPAEPIISTPRLWGRSISSRSACATAHAERRSARMLTRTARLLLMMATRGMPGAGAPRARLASNCTKPPV